MCRQLAQRPRKCARRLAGMACSVDQPINTRCEWLPIATWIARESRRRFELWRPWPARGHGFRPRCRKKFKLARLAIENFRKTTNSSEKRSFFLRVKKAGAPYAMIFHIG